MPHSKEYRSLQRYLQENAHLSDGMYRFLWVRGNTIVPVSVYLNEKSFSLCVVMDTRLDVAHVGAVRELLKSVRMIENARGRIFGWTRRYLLLSEKIDMAAMCENGDSDSLIVEVLKAVVEGMCFNVVELRALVVTTARLSERRNTTHQACRLTPAVTTWFYSIAPPVENSQFH